MSKLTTYILSRGASPDHDYCWVRVADSKKIQLEIPQFFGQRLKVTDYIDSQKYSIILAYSDGEYLLLVTALDTSPERTDFMGRRIRNSIAWVAQASSDEEDKLIRALAIKALNKELDNPVHKSVENDPNNIQTGFSVEYSKLIDIQKSCKDLVEDESTTYSLTFEYAYDNNKNRERVINELSNRSLQSFIKEGGTDILLLVTTIKSPQGFEKMQVWRGLSSRVPEELEWQEVEVEVKKKSSSKRLIARTALIIIFLLIGMLIAGIYLYNSKQESPTTPDSEDSMEIQIIPDNQDLQMEPSMIPNNQEPQKENITLPQKTEKTT